MKTEPPSPQALEVFNRLKAKEATAFATLQKKQRLDSLDPKDKQTTQDIERQRSKMQRKCKHEFDKITGICDCCGKHRSDHI